MEFSIFEEATGRSVATGRIVAVTADRETSKPVKAPERFRQSVADFEHGN